MNIGKENNTLSALEAKLVEVTARAADLQDERRKISFAALSGDKAARKALDDANAASTTVGLEIENIHSAIEEAKRRIAEAEGEAAALVQKDKAGRAMELALSIERRGKRLDEALRALATEAEGFEDDLSELNYEIGWTHPSLANFRAIVERPLSAGLMFQPSGRTRQDGQPAPGTFKLRHVPPGERMTFAEIGDGYAKSIRRLALAILDKQEAA